MTKRKAIPRELWALAVPIVFYVVPWLVFNVVHGIFLPFHSTPATREAAFIVHPVNHPILEDALNFFLTPFFAIGILTWLRGHQRPLTALLLGVVFSIFCGPVLIVDPDGVLRTQMSFLTVGAYLPAVMFALMDRRELAQDLKSAYQDAKTMKWVKRERKMLPKWVWYLAAPMVVFVVRAVTENLVFVTFIPSYWNPRVHTPDEAERETFVRCVMAFSSAFASGLAWSMFTPFLRTFGAMITGALFVSSLLSPLDPGFVNLGKWTLEGGPMATACMALGLVLPIWIWSGFERKELIARWKAWRER